MKYCEKADKYCNITKDTFRNTSLNVNTETILVLKDCSEKTCQYRGQEGCLIETNK